MLLRFSVANFRSILSRQEISLVGTRLKGPATNFLTTGQGDKVLPAAVLYGANASGKTGFVRAMLFMANAVRYSHSRAEPDGQIERHAFALDPVAVDLPTALEMDFVVEGTRYQYGFEASNEKFVTEWLYNYPEGKARKLFERRDGEISFGPTLRGQKKLLSSLTRPNSLFLSTATQNDHQGLSTVTAFFRKIKYASNLSVEKSTVNMSYKKSEVDPRVIRFLASTNTGITGYRKVESDLSELQKSLYADLDAVFRKNLSGPDDSFPKLKELLEKEVAIELQHAGKGEESFFLPISEESSGTRRLLLVMNKVFEALDTGGIIIVDEIDASLHTNAAESILALFSDEKVNRTGAQLICTTHDTNLMKSRYLRRDQVWFVEKNACGESEVFSLADIKSREGDNFEAGYLEGRYGATAPKPNGTLVRKVFDL